MLVLSTPGCCGEDGMAYFEMVWNGDYPAQDAWIAVTGKLEVHDDNGFTTPRLVVSSLDEKETRGLETAAQ